MRVWKIRQLMRDQVHCLYQGGVTVSVSGGGGGVTVSLSGGITVSLSRGGVIVSGGALSLSISMGGQLCLGQHIRWRCNSLISLLVLE